MLTNSRPVAVWVVAFIYLAVGCIGFVFHFYELWQPDGAWVELVEALAIVIGIFLLLGKNWARWLAIVWMAFHVAISYGDFRKLLIHTCILALIAWLLFRKESTRYFCAAKVVE